MGDLQPIIDAILKDARIKAEEIAENAKSRASRILAELDCEKERERKRFDKELEKEIDRIYDTEKSLDRQLVKTAILKAKGEFVKEAVVAAKRKLYMLDDKEYAALMERLYQTCGADKKGLVCLNERDKKRIKKNTFAGAQISDSIIQAEGGFVVVSGRVSYDCTFDSLFEEKYNEICDGINALCREVQT